MSSRDDVFSNREGFLWSVLGSGIREFIGGTATGLILKIPVNRSRYSSDLKGLESSSWKL